MSAQAVGVDRYADLDRVLEVGKVAEPRIARRLHHHAVTVMYKLSGEQVERFLDASDDHDLRRIHGKRPRCGQVIGNLHAQAPQAFRRPVLADRMAHLAQQRV